MATDVADIRAKLSLESAAFRAGAERARSSFNQMANGIAKDASAIRKTTEALGTVMKGVVAALSVQKVVQSADAFTNMANRLNLVAKSGDSVQRTLGALFALSQQNRTGLEGTVELYTRIAQATEKFGLSQKTLIEVVDSVGKAVTLSGASAGAATGALIQLGQGLGSAALRGDELNSVIESTPRLAKAIADGMGLEGGISALRKLAEQGKVTSSAVVQALISQNKKLNEEFGKTSSTVSQALTQVENSWLMFIGQVSEGGGFKGLSNGLSVFAQALTDPAVLAAAQALGNVLGVGLKAAAAAMQFAADHARELAVALTAFAAIKTAEVAVAAATGIITLSNALVAAAKAGNLLEIVMSKSALGMLAKLALAAGVAAGAYGYLGETAKGILDPMSAMGEITGDVAADVNKLKNAATELTTAQAKALSDLKAQNVEAKALLQAWIDENHAVTEQGKSVNKVNDAMKAGQKLRELQLSISSAGGKAIAAQVVQQERLNRAIDAQKQINTKHTENLDLSYEIKAYQGLGRSINKVAAEIEAKNAVQKLGLDIDKDQGKELYNEILLNDQLTKRLQARKQIYQASNENKDLQAQSAAYQGIGGRIEDVNSKIAAQNALREVGLTLADKEGKALYDQIVANEKLKQQVDLQKQAYEDMVQAVKEPLIQAIRNIQDVFSDALYDAAKGGIDSFSDAFDRIKDLAIQTAAQIASAMILQPIISPIIQGITAASVTGAGGLGGGLSAAGTALNASSFGTAINGFGANLGLSSGVAGTGFVNAAGQTVPGAVAPGIFGSTATLTSVLGAGALGALGGNLLSGLTGGTKLGSTVGGGGGAALGALLGSAVPGVGTALGGLIGGLGGSLFGGLFGNEDPSDKRQGVRLDLATGLSDTFGQTGEKYSQANAQAAASIAASAQSFAQSLQQLTGGAINTGFEVSKGDRDGYKLAFGNEAETTYKDQAALESALVKKIIESLKGASGTAAQLLKSGKLDLTNTDEVMQGLNLAKVIEDLKNGGNAANSYAAQIRAVEKEYASGISMARRLGLSEAELVKARDKQVASLRDAQKAAWAADAEQKRAAKQARIDAVANPLKEAVNQFDQISQSLLDVANDRVASLADYRKSLQYGDTGSLSRPDQLSAAAKDFRDTIAKAQGGDSSAFSDITSTAEQYRTLARQQYGSTSAYQNVNAQIEKMIAAVQKDQEARAKQLEADRKRQGLIADKTLEAEETQVQQLGSLTREIRELKQQLARVQRAA